MMKRLLTVLFSTLVLFSCSTDEPAGSSDLPQACFTLDAGAVAGTPIAFNSSCSKNAATYAWSFGDGATSTEAGPTHTYTSKGSYNVKLSITTASGASHEMAKTLEVADVPASAVTTHFGDINKDEVWQAGIHKVFGWVNVNNATLTIMPGAIIRFMEGASLDVGSGSEAGTATLIAEGTASQPIIFTADTDTPRKGYWKGISFGAGGSGNSSLAHCRVEWSGSNYSMLSIYGTKVSIVQSKFLQSSSNGINLGDSGNFKAFSNNEISDCNGYAMEIAPNRVPDIGLNNNFAATKGILIGLDRLTDPDVVWKKQSCPYIIHGGFSINDQDGTSLTLDPGVTVKFSQWSKLTVGYSATSTGKLIAEGTAAEPVTFTTEEDASAGNRWEGIRFHPGTDPATSLKHCVIENANGGPNTGNYASIIVEAPLHINHTTIRNPSGTAISCLEEGYFNSFENNTLVGTDRGVRMYGNWVHTLGNTNQITAAKEIVVEKDVITHPAVTWKKQPYPYYMADHIEIGSATGSTLTIAPGNTLKFMAYGSIDANYAYGIGNLIAHGTASEPIVFTSGWNTPAAGNFRAINLGEGSSMNYCVVEFSGYYSSYGSIYITSDKASVKNSTIKNSKNYGIVISRSNPVVENNTFINNAGADYYHTM